MSSDEKQSDGAGAELVLAGDPGLALLTDPRFHRSSSMAVALFGSGECLECLVVGVGECVEVFLGGLDLGVAEAFHDGFEVGSAGE